MHAALNSVSAKSQISSGVEAVGDTNPSSHGDGCVLIYC